MQLGNPAEAGNHDRVSLAEVFQADAAVGKLLDPQLVAGDGRVAVDETPLRLPRRPAAELQRTGLVFEPLRVSGIDDLDTKFHRANAFLAQLLILFRWPGLSTKRAFYVN